MFSCDKKDQENELDLLVSKKWIQTSPKPTISLDWPPFAIECPDSICTDNSSIQFEPNGVYIRQDYFYFNSGPIIQKQDLQFLMVKGTWKKVFNEIHLSSGNVINIDHKEISKDSIFLVLVKTPSYIQYDLFEKMEFDSLNNKNLLTDKWIIKNLSKDLLIISSVPFGKLETHIFVREN
jgi:hypothetical protein